jgi:hypothetical protein
LHSIDILTEINLDDLVSSFGWQASPFLAGLLRRVFYAPARKFAAQMVDFDRMTGQTTLSEAANRTIRDFAASLQAYGLENIPASGPLLVLSNHPGMVDTLALFAAIQRPDLRILALNRPFLQSMPNITKKLFYLSDNAAERMGAVKKAASHLRNGGALLTFPAGQIEPDPAVYPGALEALESWSDSAGVFVRFAPETKIIPALVRGVLWDKAVKHPLTRFKKTRYDREKLGAALQLLAHMLFDARPLAVKVQFAQPLALADSTSQSTIHAAVLGRMRGLISNPFSGEERSLL